MEKNRFHSFPLFIFRAQNSKTLSVRKRFYRIGLIYQSCRGDELSDLQKVVARRAICGTLFGLLGNWGLMNQIKHIVYIQ